MEYRISFILCLPLILILSCGINKGDIKEDMQKKIKQNLLDNAFKENTKLDVLKIETVRFDTVNENYLYTILLNSCNSEMEDLSKDQESIIIKLNNAIKMNRLSQGINKALFENSKLEIAEYSNEIKSLQTKMKICLDMDSVVRDKIKNNKSDIKLYRSFTYIKCTINKNGKSGNIIDTLIHFFTPDIKIIEPKAYTAEKLK